MDASNSDSECGDDKAKGAADGLTVGKSRVARSTQIGFLVAFAIVFAVFALLPNYVSNSNFGET